MKILNFGSLNIDNVYSVGHIVTPGETAASLKLEQFEGGKGLNQSVAISRAGCKVYHAGCIGSDGQSLKTLLEKSGVDLKYLKTVDEKTGHAIIQVEQSGENCILLFAGANHLVSTDFIDTVLNDFEKGDLLVLQNEISNLPYLVNKAYEKGMKIILNPSPYNEVIGQIDLNKLYCLILNEVESECISGVKQDGFNNWAADNYPNLVFMLTLGKKGCRYIKGSTVFEQGIFKVDTVDTTGAGDTFTGYFVAGLANGYDVPDILRVASAASALAVSKKGAAPSIPTADKVKDFLKIFQIK